jgi:hypothetical protein
MTPQQWVGLGVRLFAVWLFVTGLQYAVSIPAAISRAGADGNAVWSYVFGAAYFAIAVLLWIFPMAMAHRIVPKSHDTIHLRPAAFDAARVGIALLGLWLLVQYAMPFVLFVFNLLFFAGHGSYFGALSPEHRLQVLVYVVGTAVALFLLLKSTTVAKLILGSRTELPPAAEPRGAGR